MPLKKFVIGMLTEGIPFDGTTAWTQALGGSETAFSYMARELAFRGHDVKAFTLTPEASTASYTRDGKTVGVAYHSIGSFGEFAAVFEWDVLIVSRMFAHLGRPFKSRLNVLWNHDILTDDVPFVPELWKTDLLLNVSKFHRDQYLEKAEALRDITHATRNGIDWDEIEDALKTAPARQPLRFVYGSRPERGLDVLVNSLWPKIREKYPEAELYLCGYDVGGARIPDDYRQWHDSFMRSLRDKPGVTFAGRLPKADLYRLLASAQAVLYPTAFPEVHCILATEAQACGTPIITTHNFALPETVIPWGLVKPGPDYATKFLAKVTNLIEDPKLAQRLSREGREFVKARFQWRDIAAEWETLFVKTFEDRWARNKPAILRRLMFNSDYLVAREWSKEVVTEDPTIQRDLDAVTIGGEEEYVPTDEERQLQAEHWDKNPRWHRTAALVNKWEAKSVLDVGCGMGTLMTYILAECPGVETVHGVDFSEVYTTEAREFIRTHQPDRAEKATVFRGDVREGWTPPLVATDDPKTAGQSPRQYDVVFAGEIIEHLEDYSSFLTKLESWVKPGGHLILTCPNGSTEALSYQKNGGLWKGLRLHIRHFEFHDLLELLGSKTDFHVAIVPFTVSPIDHSMVSMWFLSYQVDGTPHGTINFERKVKTARPYPRISFCMIAKNEEDNIGRLLKSVRSIVDEIVVGDTGSTDGTVAIAEKYADKVLHLSPDPDGDGLGNFAAWRNATIDAAEGEWILWGDADEELIGADRLRRYLEGPLFEGYVIHQVHLMVDMKANPDVPVRIFRKGYRFYGVVHEHAEQDFDKPITPVSLLPDVKFAHYGYVTEGHRRSKALHRNLALMDKDARVNPQRRLTKVLRMRDLLNLTEWDREKHDWKLTPTALGYLREVVGTHLKHFNDPTDLYYKLSFELYQKALAFLGRGGYPIAGMTFPFEVAMFLTGSPNGVEDVNLKPDRRWFATKKEFLEYMAEQSAQMAGALTGPGGGSDAA